MGSADQKKLSSESQKHYTTAGNRTQCYSLGRNNVTTTPLRCSGLISQNPKLDYSKILKTSGWGRLTGPKGNAEEHLRLPCKRSHTRTVAHLYKGSLRSLHHNDHDDYGRKYPASTQHHDSQSNQGNNILDIIPDSAASMSSRPKVLLMGKFSVFVEAIVHLD